MSASLYEEDPKRKLRIIDFTKHFNFVAYRLTRGEAEQIFLFADANRDGLLEQIEWENFIALYVLPFEACDMNKDYLLDANEFGFCFQKDPKFRTMIFMRKYGTNAHQKIMGLLLDANEFGFCFQKDPKFRTMIFMRKYGTNAHQKIMEEMSTRQANLINFNEYLFIKRALYSWMSCQSNAKFIAKTHFSCALKTALSFERKITYKLTDNDIYMAGLRIDNDHDIQLNFISYLRILHYFNIFNIYSSGNSVAQIPKDQFIKAIREDKLPNNLEEEEVLYWYDLISSDPFKKAETMNFPSFVFFFSLHKLFNKYSVSKPHQLDESEVLKLMKDEIAPANIIHSIDRAQTNFNEAEYQEASLSINRLRINESNYYTSFLALKENKEVKSASETVKGKFLANSNSNSNSNTKEKEASTTEEAFNNMFTTSIRAQLAASLTAGFKEISSSTGKTSDGQDASENTAAIWNPKSVNATYYPNAENEANRKVFFTTFTATANFWTKQDYYRGFSLANLFAYLVPDIRFVIPSTEFVEKLMTTYDKVTPAISSKQRENYGLYKLLSRDVFIDVLTFSVIENYKHKFTVTLRSSNQSIPETLLKLAMQDFGMKDMPDTVVDIGRAGNSISRQRMFDPDKTMKNLIFVHSVAAENRRNKNFREKFGLKKNLDPSRRFPRYPRRAQASPFA
eukprot:CAMPEP_0170536388 /NCGR_PEP_ID=MMETSP0209-20121228/102120_1 /TAXON_ID=665100 ORGANISM="Litonotus pictus, Strain P1" /NCGR_SAMPLE_ID=MMETSP0209 /ASSEMBLY_ACC=CAM_ASM_000301 /LENGTH=679 /DNA_ID=CAMNT_0010837749 /DNA_START=197 /DNA_END=2237 /DNA_ORIENTATION=+